MKEDWNLKEGYFGNMKDYDHDLEVVRVNLREYIGSEYGYNNDVDHKRSVTVLSI